tara:strand:+ start:234 stop:737 length:504 start_codon:yes stop_codon:yes gene_type:complete
MADNFLEEYQANKDQEAMAGLDKLIAKDRLMTKLSAGEDMAGMAMMAAGPGKFKTALGYIPTVVDKVDNFKSLIKFDDILMKLKGVEQQELAKAALPKLVEGKDRIKSIIRADVLNNPNAKMSLVRTLETNERHYGSLARKLESIIEGTYESMNTGGVATLMPLKYY